MFLSLFLFSNILISFFMFIFSVLLWVVIGSLINNVIVKQSLINLSMLFWIVVFNSSIGFLILIGWIFNNPFNFVFNNQWLVNIRVNEFSIMMVVVCFCISSCVILNTVNYLSIKESIICLIFIILFQFFMIIFIVSNSILISFLGWDWLGLISYFCINFWSSKTRNGLKAILFNKLGDVMFLFLLIYYYYFNSILFSFDSFSLFLLTLIIKLFSGDIIWFLFIISFIFFALFSKSAMIPFSSWLVSAMLAPTPISALLHSSTMVIAGVYFGLLICFLLALCVQFLQYFLFFPFIINCCYYYIPFIHFFSFYLNWFIYFFISLVCFSLNWSLFKAVSLTDIKSIIAYSTISQISYMFLCILFFPQYSLYHIIIHGLFKSLLFLLSGSLIHVQLNFQSIYKMRVNNFLIKVSFILGVVVLILSLSKEGIIHSSYIMFSSSFIFLILIIGGLLTCFYSSRLVEFCFCFHYIIKFLPFINFYLFSISKFYSSYFNSYFYNFSSFIKSFVFHSVFKRKEHFIFFVGVLLIVDDIFEFSFLFMISVFVYSFPLFTFSTFYILGFSLIFVFAFAFSFGLFSIHIVYYESFVSLFIVSCMFNNIFNRLLLIPFLSIIFMIQYSIHFCFDCRSSYLISFFNYFFKFFLFFIFYPSIYCIEVLSGFKSCYSIYQIHYITSYLLICFFLFFVLLFLIV